eukprot:jgi/Psemu1/61058/gm1.61058_g
MHWTEGGTLGGRRNVCGVVSVEDGGSVLKNRVPSNFKVTTDDSVFDEVEVVVGIRCVDEVFDNADEALLVQVSRAEHGVLLLEELGRAPSATHGETPGAALGAELGETLVQFQEPYLMQRYDATLGAELGETQRSRTDGRKYDILRAALGATPGAILGAALGASLGAERGERLGSALGAEPAEILGAALSETRRATLGAAH